MCPKKPFSRPKYFHGKILTEEDFQDEQPIMPEDAEEDSIQYSRVQESFEIQYETENPLSKHRLDKCGVFEEQHSI